MIIIKKDINNNNNYDFMSTYENNNKHRTLTIRVQQKYSCFVKINENMKPLFRNLIMWKIAHT